MNDQLEQLQSEQRGTFGDDSMESTATGLLERPPVRIESPRPVAVAPPVRPSIKPAEPKRSAFDDNEEGEETLFDRHRGKFIFAAVLAIGGATAFLMSLPKTDIHMRKAPERMVTVSLPPPAPPPPPPPPPKMPPPEEKMIEQAPVEEEPKPEQKLDDPPPSIATGIKGDGPGLSGLSSKGDGSRIGGFGAGGRAAGRWDGYARGVQSSASDAIRKSPKTRAASIRGLQVRIWVDATGRVTRVKLSGSTGDQAVDSALENEVLRGLQLQPPPPGMPSPIVLRISARRP